jgi:Protein of unknown function (DUF3489)
MKRASKSSVTTKTSKAAAKPELTRPVTKHDQILKLLRQEKGASLDVLVRSSGWQKHSIRGFLAGIVRKKLKLPLISEKIDGVRTYRIGSAKSVKPAKKAVRRAA